MPGIKCVECDSLITGLRKNPYRRHGHKLICSSCQEIIDKKVSDCLADTALRAIALAERRRQIVYAAENKIKEWHTKKRLALQSSKRRAVLRSASGFYTEEDIEYLLRMQGCKCVACDIDITDNYHVDHIYALSAGGSNDKSNIQLLCPQCNLRKNKQDPILFLQRHGLNTYCRI